MPTPHTNTNIQSDRSELSFVFNSQRYPVSELTEFTFLTPCEPLAAAFDPDLSSKQFDGRIDYGDESIPFKFRIRRIEDGRNVRCGFHDLPIKIRESLISLRNRSESQISDELHALSYDELADGNTSRAESRPTAERPKQTSTFKKAIAMVVLLSAMALILGWIVYVIQSRSTVAVANSVLVGNYQPVNTPLQGKLLEVLVEVGEHVEKGQPLAILSNDESISELAVFEAQLMRTKRELAAYKQQAKKIESLMVFAKQKADRDLAVAEAELLGGKAELAAAQSQVNRLQPLVARGNIGLFEVEEAKALVASGKANLARQQALIDTLKFSKTAVAQSVFVSESGVSDPLAEITTKIALTQAAMDEAKMMHDHLSTFSKPTELTAPKSGVVYAVYKRPGEFLKVAEQAVAISLNQAGWATGHIAPELATEIRPGQPVEIEIPSMGIETTGKVTGIGHRSVYGRGGYNAEFRGGPLSVPIRVELENMDQSIPSGLRLNMTVRVNDRLAEMREWFRSITGKENKATTSVSTPANAF